MKQLVQVMDATMGRKKTGRTTDPLGIKRASKSLTLATSKTRGSMAEKMFASSQGIVGHDVKRINKGGDYVVQEKLLGKEIGKPITYEIKTGKARLSKPQRQMKKKLGKRYKVVRYS